MTATMLLSTLLLVPILQEPGAVDVRLFPGGVEAPTQPFQRSGASFERTPRFEPQLDRTAVSVRTRIGSLVEVRGQEENQLVGVGLVTGLAGTGDSTNMVRSVLDDLLKTHNVRVDLQQLTPKNIALVRVEAAIPAGIRPGRRIDVRVSTLGDAKSLENGTLALTELTDLSGQVVFATAAGPLSVGGTFAEGDGATVKKNSVTVGVLAMGGKVERSVPSRIVNDHGFIYLDAKSAHGSYGNIVRIADEINHLYPGVAEAKIDGRTVRVKVLDGLQESDWLAYLDSILKLEVVPDNFPRVILNERSGVIVMGEGVRLRPMAVSFGALTVTVAETPETSQPGGFSNGQSETLSRTEISVTEENNGVAVLPGAATLQEVVEVLNVLGTTPRDTISILQAMAQSGMLLADIQRM